MERTKLESNVSASRKFPSGPKDDVQRLSPQQWALAGRALLCAASTYRSASEASSQCGRILKEVEGKHPDGSDFMMARVIRSEDGQFAGKCWVAFRGTASKEGWKANFNAMGKKEPFSEGHKVWVASSWKHCYRTLQSGLREALLEAYKKGDCDPEQIYYTGHSLGGVLANYAALDNLAGVDGHQAKATITSGCPRPWYVTDKQCRNLEAALPPSLRFVRYLASANEKFDLITNLPPTLPGYAWMPRFRHCSRLNVGLWAVPAATAPSHCENTAMDAEHCAIMSIVHGVTKLAENAPYGGLHQGDSALHDSEDYATIAEVDGTLQASLSKL
ncbi:unnamed protein product [Symbiodinium natans]|uniref:Fungal lipase-type domain-containing protein n=1 Tax=Symbiodinium natans TaxID=878477 RepID=A0A812TLB3_9DINO|nr:unnamed protein product [Symbiodinium natans]